MTTNAELRDAPGRPVYRGLPVPWVALWSAEEHTVLPTLTLGVVDGVMTLAFDEPGLATHPFGTAAAFRAQRDEYGLLWFPDRPGGQDVGEPRFAKVHALRQRQCMLDRLCQVCGKQFPEGKPVTFLEEANTRDLAMPPWFSTLTAPTCLSCLPAAMLYCPEQRRARRVLITTPSYEPVDVLGDVYEPVGEDGNGKLVATGRRIRITSPTVARTVAKQLAVKITDYTEEPVA